MCGKKNDHEDEQAETKKRITECLNSHSRSTAAALFRTEMLQVGVAYASPAE